MAVFTVIDHTELSSAAASYSVTSIPTSYDHLYLLAQSSTSHTVYYQNTFLRFNGDTGYHYNSRKLQFGGSPSSGGTGKNLALSYIENLYVNGSNTHANMFSTMEMWIFGYKSTIGHVSVLAQAHAMDNTSTNYQWGINGHASNWVGSDGSTPEAIDEITLTPSSGNYVQYSTFTLYGVTNDA